MTVWAGLRRLALAAFLVAGASVAPARADDVSAEGAARLERQIHDWLASMVGPDAKLGDRPVEVTAGAGHYQLVVQTAALVTAVTGMEITGAPFSVQLTPLDGGRWASEASGTDRKATASIPSPDGTGRGTEATVTIAAYDQHGVIDPSLATASHLDATTKGYKAIVTGPGDTVGRTSSLEEGTAHLGWQPAAAGRIDVVEDSEAQLFVSNAAVPNSGMMSTSIERLRSSLRLDGVAPDHAGTLIRAAVVLVPAGMAAMRASGANREKLTALATQERAAAEADRRAADADRQAVAAGKMTQADRTRKADERRIQAQARQKALQAAFAANKAAMPALSAEQTASAHEALAALADLLTGFDEQVTAENLHFSVAGHRTHIDKVVSGLTASAPDGRALVRLNLAMDGFSSPDLAAGPYHDLSPHHFAISPRIGGLPTADLRDFLLRAADHDTTPEDLRKQELALLVHGPLVVGLDALSLDVGPATLTGTGEVRIFGFGLYEGEAHLVMTGLDALIAQSSGVPQLKSAVPVMFLLKGMGKQEGTTTVWDITYRDGHALVNGTDVAGLIPHK